MKTPNPTIPFVDRTCPPTRQLPRVEGASHRPAWLVWLALVLGLAGLAPTAWSQGCVAVKNSPCSALMDGSFTNLVSAHQWIGSLTYRWYKSDRHFIGDQEQPQRQKLGSQVENDVSSFDVSATYGLTKQWSVTMDLPFTFADRSSLYEHDFTNRHTMHAGGLGDLRMLTDYWLFNPHTHMNGNIALGAGFKAPTGDDHASDICYRTTGQVYRPVDPSIQPGDGGWGIILQLQAFQKIVDNLYAYVNGSYMMTPEEQNNTQFTIADQPRFAALLTPLRTYNTIADQYLGRGGFSYAFWPAHGLSVSLGALIEGVPVYDAIGGSMGFRRPGYTISIEPGLSWSFGRNTLAINTPVAVYRNRERSAPEIALGVPGGDAAFADFSIQASFSHSF